MSSHSSQLVSSGERPSHCTETSLVRGLVESFILESSMDNGATKGWLLVARGGKEVGGTGKGPWWPWWSFNNKQWNTCWILDPWGIYKQYPIVPIRLSTRKGVRDTGSNMKTKPWNLKKSLKKLSFTYPTLLSDICIKCYIVCYILVTVISYVHHA